MNRTVLISSLALLALAGICGAAILNVPLDYELIQNAINNSSDGDTVLVQPGRYWQNINFSGKDITVGSLFLTTGDTSYVDSTIIDGDANGTSVVVFGNGETAAAILAGFTVTNGSSDYGGGIYINAASPIIHHNRVIANRASGQGGGIYCTQNAAPLLEYLLIANNEAGGYGGGISCYHGSIPHIRASVIIGNTCEFDGGGIHISYEAKAMLEYLEIRDNRSGQDGGGISSTEFGSIINNCKLTGNAAGRWGGGIYSNASDDSIDHLFLSRNVAKYGSAIAAGGNYALDLRNCTIVDNDSALGAVQAWGELAIVNCILLNSDSYEVCCDGGHVTMDYSDVEDGQAGLGGDGIDWSEGNIDADPLFVNPESGDYHLTGDSPCIDAGDPNSPKDPDSTRADIGALHFHQSGSLEGYVYDSIDGSPIREAILFTNIGDSARTDAQGFYQIPGVLTVAETSLTARMAGFIDSVLNGIQIGLNDTAQFDFSLWHPVPEPAVSFGEEVSLSAGDSTQGNLPLRNSGNYPLTWSLERRLPGEQEEPWTKMATYNVSQLCNGDPRINGVVCIGGRFYVAGGGSRSSADNHIYVLNSDGQLVDMYDQPGDSPYGMQDLAYDGSLIWGAAEDTVYGFTPRDGLVETAFIGPDANVSALAWDPDRELLWICGITSDKIYGYGSDGNQVTSISQRRLRVYGLAYLPEDHDFPLYLFCNQTSQPDQEIQLVYRMNPDTGDTAFVAQLSHAGEGSPMGAEITDQFAQFNWVFLSVVNNGADDRLDVWYMDADPSFIQAEPMSGVVAAGESADIQLEVSAAGLDSGEYKAVLRLDYPEIRSSSELPLALRVTPNGISDLGFQIADFRLSEPYPNPFNGLSIVNYQLSIRSAVTLGIYDIAGREISHLDLGIMNAGEHRAVINGGALASGVYLLKLVAGSDLAARKVVCVK